MNRDQQCAKHKLDRALNEYLVTMGWKIEDRVRGLLSHPKLKEGRMHVPAIDAWALTRADPTWGWPMRVPA